MGDLREDLIRLMDTWESRVHGGSGAGKRSTYRTCASELRCLLASHPAPSPSVSRDAETGRTAWRCHCGAWNYSACRACGKGPDERWASGAGFDDTLPAVGCADALGLAPSPRSEAEGTRAPACHCGDVLRERPCPFCSPEAYYGAGRAPVPAESATRDLLRVIENPAVPDGTAYMLSVVEGPDGEKRLDAVKVTGIGAAATKGEEDGR